MAVIFNDRKENILNKSFFSTFLRGTDIKAI